MIEEKQITDFTELVNAVEESSIVAVLVIDEISSATKVASILIENGINAIELALRTTCAVDAIRDIKREIPDMIIGAGTVLTPDQVVQVTDAGADFALAPGLNTRVVEKAKDLDLPFIPGITTPSDIETALELGCTTLKFFPAEPSGGGKYLKSMSGPYNHLGLKYMPLGGLSEDNFMSYFSLSSVFAIGGSWIATRDLIAQGNWRQIEANAQNACEIKAGSELVTK